MCQDLLISIDSRMSLIKAQSKENLRLLQLDALLNSSLKSVMSLLYQRPLAAGMSNRPGSLMSR